VKISSTRHTMSFDQIRKMAYVGVMILTYMTSSASISRLVVEKRVFEPTACLVGDYYEVHLFKISWQWASSSVLSASSFLACGTRADISELSDAERSGIVE